MRYKNLEVLTTGLLMRWALRRSEREDIDSFWIEKLDVDGNGDVEDTNLVWDDEDRILFAYSVGAFTCRNGGTETGKLRIATNSWQPTQASGGIALLARRREGMRRAGRGIVGRQVRRKRRRDRLRRRRARRED